MKAKTYALNAKQTYIVRFPGMCYVLYMYKRIQSGYIWLTDVGNASTLKKDTAAYLPYFKQHKKLR